MSSFLWKNESKCSFFFIFSELKEITLARMFECRPLKSIFSFFSTSLFQ